jgi:hypothetical protein
MHILEPRENLFNASTYTLTNNTVYMCILDYSYIQMISERRKEMIEI